MINNSVVVLKTPINEKESLRGITIIPTVGQTYATEHWPLWSYQTGGDVDAVSLSADGEWVTAGNRNGGVYLFQKNTSIPEWNYAGGQVYSMDISADGKYIVSSCLSGINFFKRESSIPYWSYNPLVMVNTIVISPDGELIAACARYELELLSRGYANPKSPFWSWDLGVGNLFHSVAITPDYQFIVAGNDNNNIYLLNHSSLLDYDLLWGAATGGDITAVAISADGQYIAAGSKDQSLYLYNQSTPVPLWSAPLGMEITTATMSANGSHIAVGGNGPTVFCFNQTASTWNYTLESGDASVLSLSMSSNGQQLVIGGMQRVYLLNPWNMTVIWSHYVGNTIPTIEISQNGTYLVAGSADGNVYLFHRTEVGSPDIPWVPIILAAAGVIAVVGISTYYFHRRRHAVD